MDRVSLGLLSSLTSQVRKAFPGWRDTSVLEEHEDPIVTGLLSLLASDLRLHPDRVEPFPAELLARATELTKGIDIDHEAPIDGVTAF